MGGSSAGDEILSAYIAWAGTNKLQVSDDDIAAATDFKDAGIPVTLFAVAGKVNQRLAGYLFALSLTF